MVPGVESASRGTIPLGLLGLALALCLTGCSGSGHRVLAPAPSAGSAAPPADSPAAAVLALQWSYAHRDTTAHRNLYTDDYVFVFGPKDSANFAYLGGKLTVGQETRYFARVCITGSQTEPRADRIDFVFLTPLVAEPDPRPDRDDRFHSCVSARILFTLDHNGSHDQASGRVDFYLARGDAANRSVRSPGVDAAADSTRWFIERWEDGTGTSVLEARGLQSSGTMAKTLGQFKALYLDAPSAARSAGNAGAKQSRARPD